MKRIVSLVVASFLLISPSAWARTAAHDAAESPQYGRKAGGMIGRGILNVATCFVDPIVHLVNKTKAGPPLVGTLAGIGSGLGCGVLRLGSGAVDIVTFWVPGFNGFPVSDSYENCLAGVGSGASAASPQPAYMPAPTTFAPESPSVQTPAQSQPAAGSGAPAAQPRKWTK